MSTHKIKYHQKRHRTNIQYWLCVVHKQDTLFDAVEFQQGCLEKPFALGVTCITPLSQHVQQLFVQHTDKIKNVNVILKVLYI